MADVMVGQAAAGQRAPLRELVRQLAGRKAARGLRPMAALRAADGRVISRRGELLECQEDLFAAEFSGHTCPLAYQEARQEAARVIQDLTPTDVHLPEFEWVCAMLDALAARKLERAVGPDAVPVEVIAIRAAGIF